MQPELTNSNISWPPKDLTKVQLVVCQIIKKAAYSKTRSLTVTFQIFNSRLMFKRLKSKLSFILGHLYSTIVQHLLEEPAPEEEEWETGRVSSRCQGLWQPSLCPHNKMLFKAGQGGPVAVKFWRATWAWNNNARQMKWWQMACRSVQPATEWNDQFWNSD